MLNRGLIGGVAAALCWLNLTTGVFAETQEKIRCEEARAFGLQFVADNVVIPANAEDAALCAATALESSGYRYEAESLLLRLLVQSDKQSVLHVRAVARLGLFYADHKEIEGLIWAWDHLSEVCNSQCDVEPFLTLSGPIISIATSDFQRGELKRSLSLAERLRSVGKSRDYRGDYFDPPWLPQLYSQLGREHDAEDLYKERIRLAPSEAIRAQVEREYQVFLDERKK